MDALSDVMTTLRVDEPDGARVEWRAPWSVRFPDEPGAAGFLVMLHGWAWMWLDEDTPVALGPGDVVLSPNGAGFDFADSPTTPFRDAGFPHEPLAKEGEGPTTVTLCGGYRLDTDRVHPLLRELPETIHISASVGRHPRLRAVVEILGDEIHGERPGTDAIVPSALDMLLLYALRAWFEDQPSDTSTATGWAAALGNPQVSASLNAIHTDPAHPWTVQTLADRARLSRATFSRRFSALVGQPPLSYLTWWRMTVAAGLLRDTDGTLAAIAAQVGYTSEFAFANAFKRHHGLSPGRFRRRAAGTTTALGTGA